jgi:hypothetical protein
MTTAACAMNPTEGPRRATMRTWAPPSPSERISAPQWGPAAGRPADLVAWLDEQERAGTHPAVVEGQLRLAGWSPPHAAVEASRYRIRFNEHPLGYAALLVSTGVAALALGTVGHMLAAA